VAIPGCPSGTIAVSAAGAGAAAGHSGIVLLFRNASARVCTLGGYPGAALVSRGGAEVNAVRTPSGYLGGLAAGTAVAPVVRVGPGQTVSALLEGDDASADGGACPLYPDLLVTPPNQTSTSHLTHSVALCSPQIHPVVTGTTGRQS
jgi:hypothetical protein